MKSVYCKKEPLKTAILKKKINWQVYADFPAFKTALLKKKLNLQIHAFSQTFADRR